MGFCCGVAALLATCATIVQAQGGGIFVTPIPNAPFSGTVRVERTNVQPSGHALQLWSQRTIARDKDGRIYNESRPFVPTTISTVPDATVIHLYDPQNRMSEYLYPQRKTYWMRILSRPPSTDTPDDFASSTANAKPASDFTRREDLGNRTMVGLPVHGVRITQTLTAEESGTGQEVTVTNEYWYSEALRMNLMTKHNDPRSGSVVMTVTQVDRSEPGAAFFGVPADYAMASMEETQGK
jgi:hypothetical protein